MTTEQIKKFEKIQSQADGLHSEIGSLSKKSPNDAVNRFKLKFINQVLSGANEFLTGRYKPFEGFEIFDEDELPTNSDVVMILEQYLNCLEQLRADNITTSYTKSGWFWQVDGEVSDLRTTRPRKLIEK